MIEEKVYVEIPPLNIFLKPAIAFILSCAKEFHLQQEKRDELQKAFSSALSLVLEKNQKGKLDELIRVEAGHSSGKLTVHILNRGIPIFASETKRFYETFKKLDAIFVENEGRKGQTLIFEVQLGEEALEKAFQVQEGSRSLEVKDEEIDIRELRPGEETALSKLFYFVYGYRYINESMYYPEKIRSLIEKGDLISIVAALPNGRLVGHVGLIRKSSSPLVYEAALGLVDPVAKSRGLFGKIFQRAMDKAKETSMHYCFFDFVTNHDYSQRLINKYGNCDMAIFVGCQTKTTQAKLDEMGIGKDPKDMERYTILFSLLPMTDHPFGKEIYLPSSLGEPLGFLLEPFNLQWVPTPRFYPLTTGGNYKTHYQPAQSSVIFDTFEPGRQAVQDILEEWEELLQNGYQYAAVEVPLDASGIGVLSDILARQGFFAAGFIPYHFSGKLGFRFQTIAPAKVAFNHIKVYSGNGKKLLNFIIEDYERNKLLKLI